MKKIICAIALQLFISCVYGQSAQRPLKISLPTSNKIVLYSDSQFIEAEGYDGHEILVIPKLSANDTLENFHLLSDNSRNSDTLINYKSQLKTGVNNFIFNKIHLISQCQSVKIFIPNNLPLVALVFNCRSSDGLIKIKNYKGALQIDATSSRLDVDGVTGLFSISDDYGEISLKHIIFVLLCSRVLYMENLAAKKSADLTCTCSYTGRAI